MEDYKSNSMNKYRGKKSLTAKSWYTGNLLMDGNKVYLVEGNLEHNGDNLIIKKWVEVHPDTLCLSTGLFDYNNKEVFEGDIGATNKGLLLEIVRHGGRFSGKVIGSDGKEYFNNLFTYDKHKKIYITVIGNRHQKKPPSINQYP